MDISISKSNETLGDKFPAQFVGGCYYINGSWWEEGREERRRRGGGK